MEKTYVFEKVHSKDGNKKLVCKIPPNITVGVNVFLANGQTYVHVGYKSKTLSLLYDDFVELCSMRQAMDSELSWLYGVSVDKAC